jgi:hypothetical protein
MCARDKDTKEDCCAAVVVEYLEALGILIDVYGSRGQADAE